MASKQKGYRVRAISYLIVFAVVGLVPVAAAYYHIHQVNLSKLVSSGDAGVRHYLLSPLHFFKFYQKLILFQAPDSAVIAAIIALSGAVILALRRRWRALPLVAVLVLMPLPFFFIPVTHWYDEKYFIAQLPGALVFISVTLVEFSRWVTLPLVRVFRRVKLAGGFKRTRIPGLLCPIILVIMVFLFTTQYMAKNVYGGHWGLPWKSFSQVMGQYMTGDDVVIHFAPYSLNPYMKDEVSFEPTSVSLDFYLQRQVGTQRTDLYPTKHLLTADTADVDRWLMEYPRQNVWLMFWYSHPIIPLTRPHYEIFQPLDYGYGAKLFIAGAPAENLIHYGADETSTSTVYISYGHVEIVEREKSNSCFKITATNDRPSPFVKFSIGDGRLSSDSYMLSMKLGYADARRFSATTGSVTIAVCGNKSDGQYFETALATYAGDDAIKFHAYQISKIRFPKLFDSYNLAVKIYNDGPTGIIWFDDVQLEAGEHPTPFVEGVRLPHDVSLTAFKALNIP